MITRLSDHLVVMSELAAELLRDVHAVPDGEIDIIPHGAPGMPFMNPNYFKDRLGKEIKYGSLESAQLATASASYSTRMSEMHIG